MATQLHHVCQYIISCGRGHAHTHTERVYCFVLVPELFAYELDLFLREKNQTYSMCVRACVCACKMFVCPIMVIFKHFGPYGSLLCLHNILYVPLHTLAFCCPWHHKLEILMSMPGSVRTPEATPLQHASTAISLRWHTQYPSENQLKLLEDNGVVCEWIYGYGCHLVYLSYPNSLECVHGRYVINSSALLPLPPGDLFAWLQRWGVKLRNELCVAHVGTGDWLHFYETNVEPEPVIGTVFCVFFFIISTPQCAWYMFPLTHMADDLRKQFQSHWWCVTNTERKGLFTSRGQCCSIDEVEG